MWKGLSTPVAKVVFEINFRLVVGVGGRTIDRHEELRGGHRWRELVLMCENSGLAGAVGVSSPATAPDEDWSQLRAARCGPNRNVAWRWSIGRPGRLSGRVQADARWPGRRYKQPLSARSVLLDCLLPPVWNSVSIAASLWNYLQAQTRS